MSKEQARYYEGMFKSLTHNILLMLSQIEGNLEYSDYNPKEDLEFVEKRIKEIKSQIGKKK